MYSLTMCRTDAETSVPSDWENSLPTWDSNPITAHARGEIIMSLFNEDNIFSKYTYLTYGPLKSKNTNST